MRAGPAPAGGARLFAALTPITPGREQQLRNHLRSFDQAGGGSDGGEGEGSPLRRVPGTHFARWVVVARLGYHGPPQKPDVLRSEYLLFTACFDGEVQAYLDRVRTGLDTDADRVWGHCVGYRGLDDLGRYLRHNQVSPEVLFAAYPADVATVKRALDRRRRLLRFVVDHQGSEDGEALRRDWLAAFPSGGDRDSYDA